MLLTPSLACLTNICGIALLSTVNADVYWIHAHNVRRYVLLLFGIHWIFHLLMTQGMCRFTFITGYSSVSRRTHTVPTGLIAYPIHTRWLTHSCNRDMTTCLVTLHNYFHHRRLQCIQGYSHTVQWFHCIPHSHKTSDTLQ